jgi:hypothetical protein
VNGGRHGVLRVFGGGAGGERDGERAVSGGDGERKP